MLERNLSVSHNSDWATFLPALSSFYIAGIGKQREGENYFDQSRMPAQIPDAEMLNFLNESNGLFTYKWVLYSAGHADLINYKTNPVESLVIKRDRENTFMLADSGGFQILKCQWPANWKDPNCPRALKKRQQVLSWMDDNADYGMCLDIPSQSVTTFSVKDKNGNSVHGIETIDDAITATHINNEYFIQNRDGRCKFLNVLQGRSHIQSDNWYNEMKKYCDAGVYGDRAFNGWAFGGQNKIDMHLMLRRLVNIIHDGYLEEGKHDLIHCLGTSILEYAVAFSDIQRAVRKYNNPKFQLTFDCASPFFAAAKGLAYNNNTFGYNKKWTYAMDKTAENKKYSTDTRKFSDACLTDGIHKVFTDSPITDRMVMKDLCYRGPGFIGQHGKETRTSWDTLSYTLLQGHNVYQHIYAVQEANRQTDSEVYPKMLLDQYDGTTFGNVVDQIFSLQNRSKSLEMIDHYSKFWMQIKAGQGFSGKNALNSSTKFNQHFTIQNIEIDVEYDDEELLDSDDAMTDALADKKKKKKT